MTGWEDRYPLTPIPSDFSGRLFHDDDDRIEAIRTWVFQNFEPRRGLLSAGLRLSERLEHAREVVESNFGQQEHIGLAAHVVEAAVEEMEREAPFWVRRWPEEQIAAYRADAHAKMLRQIAECEAGIESIKAQLRKATPAGIGHNNPPDSIDGDLVWAFAEIEQTSAILKAQPVVPTDGGEKASHAITRIGAVIERAGKWAAETIVRAFATEIAKAAWPWVFEKLTLLKDAVLEWRSTF